MDMKRFVQSLSPIECRELQVALDELCGEDWLQPTQEERALWAVPTTKMEAYKAFRYRTGFGLKEAKAALDRLPPQEEEILPCPKFESPPKTMYF